MESFLDLYNYSKKELDIYEIENIATKLQDINTNCTDIKKIRVRIISNVNYAFLEKILIGIGVRFGLNLSVDVAPYNQVEQEAFVNNKELINDNESYDFIILALDPYNFISEKELNEAETAKNKLDFLTSHIKSIVGALQKKYCCRIIVQNIINSYYPIIGSIESKISGSIEWYINQLNYFIENEKNIIYFNIKNIISRYGIDNAFDERLWIVGKIPFSYDFSLVYSSHICRLISANLGKSKRCLILDLDNTLWGGVIGDDGLDGINISNGDPTGEAHLELQRYALRLKRYGIILAVCSKNTENIAKEPFEMHPDMLLKLDDFAIFKANWNDKATNIRLIASELSLGLDSLVFVDDNPAEREIVRINLPEVAVPELSTDPSTFVSTIMKQGYFEAANFLHEDSERINYYKQNSQRLALINKSTNIDEYLNSLNMQLFVKKFDLVGLPRIVQLINKSNQFNLTTKRYSEFDITKLISDNHYVTLQLRLTDKFGDNGMIGVIILKINNDTILIDTWLMSCRVLERRVEYAAMDIIKDISRSMKITKIIGIYKSTQKNKIVELHYKKLGFRLFDEDSGGQYWIYNLEFDADLIINVPIEVNVI